MPVRAVWGVARVVSVVSVVALVLGGLVFAGCATTSGNAGKSKLPALDDPGRADIVLNGSEVPVVWSDGDSFVFINGPRTGGETRLMGFNTLESYGPVHRWGEWTREGLYAVAKAARDFSATRTWVCTATGARDTYKRLLVDCPDLRAELIVRGLAHHYPFDRDPDPKLVDLQREARTNRRGMWEKGRPEIILTTLRSFRDSKFGSARNWFVNGRDGQSGYRAHQDDYEVCEEVCEEPLRGTGSCLVYVPYALRYKDDKPACLR